MEKQELNKKLAEWAGFTLDACFKWLVPKLEYVSIKGATGNFQATIHCNGRMTRAKADTPALALCLAIEKLSEPITKEK